jgi:hypothetical protein
VPFSVLEAATPVRVTFDRSPSANLLQRDLKDRIQDMFDRAKLANVNIYTVDACGLRAVGAPCAPSADIEDYFVAVAANTGGRPVINTNDFEPGLTAIFQENASYYMLGFQSTNAARDGTRRRLEVNVNRPGVTVRTRSGYAAPDEDDRQAAKRASPLGASVAGVLPKSDLPLLVTAAPFAARGQRNAVVAVAVGVRQPVRQTGMRTVQKVDLQVSAFNTDGKTFGTTKLTAEVGLRSGDFDSAEYEVVTRLDLKPGATSCASAAKSTRWPPRAASTMTSSPRTSRTRRCHCLASYWRRSRDRSRREPTTSPLCCRSCRQLVVDSRARTGWPSSRARIRAGRCRRGRVSSLANPQRGRRGGP